MARKILSVGVSVPSGLVRRADNFAERLAKYREGSKHRNNLETDRERALEMHYLGSRGEASNYWYFGGWWGGAKWDTRIKRGKTKGTPDIVWKGLKWDAKGVPRNNYSLVVYPEGAYEDWFYVLVGLQFWPESELLGWVSGVELMKYGLRDRVSGRPAYWIEQGDSRLRSCRELVTREDEVARGEKFLACLEGREAIKPEHEPTCNFLLDPAALVGDRSGGSEDMGSMAVCERGDSADPVRDNRDKDTETQLVMPWD